MTDPRVALVTGAASGIGRGVAEVFSRAGYRVVATDINVEPLEQVVSGLENDSFGLRCDVTSSESVSAAVDEALERAGTIDVLCNVAGFSLVKPFLDTDEDYWRFCVDVNYLSVLRMTHKVLPTMIAQGRGRVVSIASERARVGGAGEGPYAGAKAAIIAFSKSVAQEVSPKGVTLNCVSPGPIDTPALDKVLAEGGPEGRAHIDKALASLPVPRLGKPEKIAAAMLYLASDEAAFVTGQTIGVGGGIAMP